MRRPSAGMFPGRMHGSIWWKRNKSSHLRRHNARPNTQAQDHRERKPDWSHNFFFMEAFQQFCKCSTKRYVGVREKQDDC